MKLFTAISLFTFVVSQLIAGTMDPPLGLLCDGAKNPLGATMKPMLTWRITSAKRNVSASAWQVLVASNEDLLKEESADFWDSGKVASGRIPGIKYGGKSVAAGTRCHWKVRWWEDGGEPSPWSDPAVWEVAPSKPKDWRGAVWIDDNRDNPTKDAEFYQPDHAPLLRREFEITKPIARARLHIAGLGLSLPSIDGQLLADHAFDPPWTNFDKRILFRTHDVTDLLDEGSHCLGIQLGNGWYNPLPLRMWGRRNIRDSLPVGRPRAIALLIVDHPDGTSTTLATGEDWQTAPGPTIHNSIYLGEVRDARLEKEGWDQPGFDASQWKQARNTGDPTHPLQPLSMSPVRKMGELPAESVSPLMKSVHIVDFGQIFTGIPQIELSAPAGTKIIFRYGELLNPDGTLNTLTSTAGQIKGMKRGPDGTNVPVGGPGAPEFAWQKDVYIAKGGGVEIFCPRFTFHSFRYMEISGLEEVDKADCRAFPMRTDLPSAGSFSCSDEDLNHIQEMCRRTFLANVMTVQSDCPHRERFGYGGDIVATSAAYIMNFDMQGFYSKTVRDWGDAARPDGRLTDTAPFVGIDYCGVGWAMVHPLLLEQLHQNYGVPDLLAEQVPLAMEWIENEAAARKDGLVIKGLGDHESLEQGKGPEFLTAMFIDAARRVARLARIIGKDADAASYEAMAAESAGAWTKAYLDKESGRVGVATQSAQTFALGFGAASTADREAVFGELVRNLTAPEDSPRLTTGIFGTRLLLDELSTNGRSDLAFALADREAFPSWNWMLSNGATTLWEHWAGSDTTFSNNHSMFGSISEWFYRWLGGIQCDEDAVAFDRITIRPQILVGLDWVKTSHQSIRGMILSNWKRGQDGHELEITIPPGTIATVEIPAKPGDTITESGQLLSEAERITVLPLGKQSQSFRIGSGEYHFTLRAQR